jgi:hypothetical protein
VRTYLGLYTYVARLALKAIAHHAHYLLVAPLAAIGYGFAEMAISRFIGAVPGGGGSGTGFAAGLLISLIQAAAMSLVLFVGRAIIEQRRLATEDLQVGLGAFLGDVLTIFFVAWILSMVSQLLAAIYLALIVALPMFETAALTQESGFSIFSSVLRFTQRDIGPWLIGQLPLLVLVLVWFVFEVFGAPPIPDIARPWVEKTIFWALVLMAFVYRGVLFLTLDNYSPRRRAERFGGAPGLG